MSRNPFRDTLADDLADDIAALMTGTLRHALDQLDGETVYRVPLLNQPGSFATLDKHGYDLLVAEGVDLLIQAVATGGNSYVRYQRSGFTRRWDLAARLVTGASKGQLVRYANGDRTDLRLSNLRVQQTEARAAA
jgi:hypothetical protein